MKKHGGSHNVKNTRKKKQKQQMKVSSELQVAPHAIKGLTGLRCASIVYGTISWVSLGRFRQQNFFMQQSSSKCVRRFYALRCALENVHIVGMSRRASPRQFRNFRRQSQRFHSMNVSGVVSFVAFVPRCALTFVVSVVD